MSPFGHNEKSDISEGRKKMQTTFSDPYHSKSRKILTVITIEAKKKNVSGHLEI